MRAGGWVLAATAVGVVATAAPVRAEPSERRFAVRRVVDLLRDAPHREWAEWPLIAFDGDGDLVAAWVVHGAEHAAVAWRKSSPSGVLSRVSRVDFPGRNGRWLQLNDLVVGADARTTVAVRVMGYVDDPPELFAHFDSAIVRFDADGTYLAGLSLGAPAERVRLAAHDGVVDVVFDAELTRDGDRAVWWRRIGADGAFAGDPVRLSAPALSDDPVVGIGIWDVFFGVGDDGVGRVLHRRVAFRMEGGEQIVEPPELFWNEVSADGVASPPRSLGLAQDQWLTGAFCRGGEGLVARTVADDSDSSRGTSFLGPLLVSREGALRPLQASVIPAVVYGQSGVGADARSTFRLASIAVDSFVGRIDPDVPPEERQPMRRIRPCVFLASVGEDATTSRVRRVRIPLRDVEAHHVADDGTTVLAGYTRRCLAAVILSPRGRIVGWARVPRDRGPLMDFEDYPPVVASTRVRGITRFALAWESSRPAANGGSPRYPARLRVALLE